MLKKKTLTKIKKTTKKKEKSKNQLLNNLKKKCKFFKKISEKNNKTPN